MSRLSAFGIGLAALVTVLAGSLLASGEPVSGKWNMTVKGPAAHGDMPAAMLLAQAGDKVTGTFSAHGTEHKLAGTYKDATLQLETTDTPADRSLTLSAKLQDDGTLAGFLSGPMGDMKWTASREKESK
jgi:hypothetical protein